MKDSAAKAAAAATAAAPSFKVGRCNVQVAPIKPTLKPNRTKRLKLKRNIMLSTSAFSCKLRHYTKHSQRASKKKVAKVGRCRLTRVEINVGSAWYQRL
jgi:hypothetical protein